MFGYALDKVSEVKTAPSTEDVHAAVIQAGGEYAKRYRIYADISALEGGSHTLDLLVRINMRDCSTATLKIASFSLVIEEQKIYMGLLHSDAEDWIWLS